MSTAALELIIKLKNDAHGPLKEVAKDVRDVGAAAENADRGGGGFFKNMAASAAGFLASNLISGLTSQFSGFIKDSIQESKDAAEGQAQLAAVLKSTGQAAGVTAEMANNLASKLQLTTKFTDDQVLAGENMLLTFTNIGSDVFPAATQTILDMAQATGGDLKGSAIQLGKALNDPIAGISALSRVGVTFTEQQKEQIKAMVAAGDAAGAQKLILAELGKEFGGSAEAAGKTFGGQLEILQHRFADVKQSVGDALMPVLVQFMGFLSSPAVMGAIESVSKALISGIGMAGKWLSETVIPGLIAVWGQLQPVFTKVVALIQTFIVPALTQLGALFGGVGTAISGGIGGDTIAAFVQGLLGMVGGAIAAVVPKLAQLAASFIAWIAPMIPPFLAELGKYIASMLAWMGTVALPAILQKAGEWSAAFIAWIAPLIPPLLGELVRLLGAVGSWMLTVALPVIFQKLGEWGAAFIAWIGPLIPPLLGELVRLLGAVGGWMLTVALPALITNLGIWALAFVGFIARDILPALPGKLLELIQSIGAWMINTGIPGMLRAGAQLGNAIVSGIGAGLDAAKQWLIGKMQAITDVLPQTVRDALKINSPSKVFEQIGTFTGQGWAQGLAASIPLLAQTMSQMTAATTPTPPELRLSRVQMAPDQSSSIVPRATIMPIGQPVPLTLPEPGGRSPRGDVGRSVSAPISISITINEPRLAYDADVAALGKKIEDKVHDVFAQAVDRVIGRDL